MSGARALVFVLVLLASSGAAVGQTLDPLWEGPVQLSSPEGHILDRAMAIDSRGRTHTVWIEQRIVSEEEGTFQLRYARFADQVWSKSIVVEEIEEPYPGTMTRVDLKADSTDTLHLIWGANWYPAYHRRASAETALDPKAWSGYIDIPVSTLQAELLVDVQGALLYVYCPNPHPDSDEPLGIFVVRSTDRGDTWSDPIQIDPGIPEGWYVQEFDAAWDGGDAVHVSWNYVTPASYRVQEVKYARSTDGGRTWSEPIVLEGLTGATPGFNPDFLRLAIPSVAVSGPNVHVIYAGGGEIGVGRRHVYSTDSGVTWTKPESTWGDLQGRAGTDVTYFDSRGRLHMMSQLRFPAALYHAVWDKGKWSTPEPFYQIARDHLDPVGERVHAHYLEATVSKDDNVVLTFDSCGSGCPDDTFWPDNPMSFAMHTISAPFDLPSFTSVSSATYAGDSPLAPSLIAAGFSEKLAQATTEATQTPLPTRLDGLEIEVIDSAEKRYPAGLLFVSPQQVNYVVPPNTTMGLARIRIRRNNELVSVGTAQISRVAPSIYTVRGDGTGVAAAVWLFVAKDGKRTSGLIFDPKTGKAEALEFDPSRGDLYLSLFGTGVRRYRDSIRATVGDYPTPVLSAGPQGQFEGLDQINLGPLPPELAVGAEWDITLVVDGVISNRSTLLIQDRP